MYPKFIELHDKGAGELFGININHIVSFGKDGVILTGIPTDIALATAESYDEIKQLLRDTGTLIHRADPRLDETHQLTMADLKEMIGEPVWNSNRLEWWLVLRWSDDAGEGQTAEFLGSDETHYTMSEESLIKFPLYRMRRGDHERGKGSMTEEEAEAIREEIVKSAELRQKLGAPPVEGM